MWNDILNNAFFRWLINYSVFGMGVAKFAKKFVFNKHEGCRSVGKHTKVACMVYGESGSREYMGNCD